MRQSVHPREVSLCNRVPRFDFARQPLEPVTPLGIANGSRQKRAGRRGQAQARHRFMTFGGCAKQMAQLVGRSGEARITGQIAHRSKRVAQTMYRSRAHDGSIEGVVQTLFEYAQARQKIAAVHCGNIARLERRERPRVVPVQEMTFAAPQPVERRERLRCPRQQLVSGEVSKIARRERGCEPQADVGGRSPLRDLDVQRQLGIVWTQPVAFLVYQVIEVARGTARLFAQIRKIPRGQAAARRPRLVQP